MKKDPRLAVAHNYQIQNGLTTAELLFVKRKESRIETDTICLLTSSFPHVKNPTKGLLCVKQYANYSKHRGTSVTLPPKPSQCTWVTSVSWDTYYGRIPLGNGERTLNTLVLILPFTKSTWVPRYPWKHRQEGSHIFTHTMYVILKEVAAEKQENHCFWKIKYSLGGGGEYRDLLPVGTVTEHGS